MKILITGASGLVGRELGLALARKGHEIVVLSRNKTRARSLCPFPCEIYEWNNRAATFPLMALNRVGTIVHLAGESIVSKRWNRDAKEQIYRSRVHSTKILMEILSKEDNCVSAFIQSSAIGFYGNCGEELLTEDQPSGKGFLADVCRDWEAALMANESFSQHQMNLRKVVLRLGMVLSHSGGALASMLPIFENGLGGQLGNGGQWTSWIHLPDLVRLFVFAIEENISGTFNAVAPGPVKNSEFTSELAGVLKKRVFFPVPSLGLKVAMGEAAEVLLSSQRVSAKKIQSAGFRFETEKLIDAFGLECSGASDGESEILQKQWLPRPPSEVFSFFGSEKNLELLVPPLLSFHVTKKSTDNIEAGTKLDYRLWLHGIPIHWQSRIDDWNPPFKFIDFQTKGPYRLWRHEHSFEPFMGGTLMLDRIRYKLPLGGIGRFAGGWRVRKDLRQIFDFRRTQIDKLEYNEFTIKR